MDNSRRTALRGIVGGSAALVAAAAGGSSILAQEARKPELVVGGGVAAGRHEIVPLPFNPAKLKDLSEKLISNHHGRNYAGAVRNLNKVEETLAAVTKDTSAYEVAGLRRAELTFTNSIIYHEHYFANLGGDGKINGAIAKLIGDTYGSIGKWEELFIATAMSLGGGSGWTVLDYNFHTNELRTYWADHHTLGLAYGKPLLVLDMFEHAYQLDFGPNHAKYIEAYFVNINYDEVNRRLEQAMAAAKAMR